MESLGLPPEESLED